MSSLITRVKAFFAGKEVHQILTAADMVAKTLAPEFEARVMTFSSSLPAAFVSLEATAEHLIAIVHDAKGLTVSKTLAIKTVQDLLAKNWPAIEAEAEALLEKLHA